MDQIHWKRDPAKVHAALTEHADGSLHTSKRLRLYVPKRFQDKSLVVVDSTVDCVGVFALVVDDSHYAVSTTNSMFQLSPSVISSVKIQGVDYLEFEFKPNTKVLSSVDLIRQDTIVYSIYDEIIAKGNVPWFLEYEDLAKLVDTSDEYANLRLGHNHVALEMLAAIVSRDKKERTRFYRHTVQERSELESRPPVFIPLRSIVLNATNTVTRLVGSHFEEGLSSALVNRSDKLEAIEDLLLR